MKIIWKDSDDEESESEASMSASSFHPSSEPESSVSSVQGPKRVYNTHRTENLVGVMANAKVGSRTAAKFWNSTIADIKGIVPGMENRPDLFAHSSKVQRETKKLSKELQVEQKAVIKGTFCIAFDGKKVGVKILNLSVKY